jgi:hypothetical protein
MRCLEEKMSPDALMLVEFNRAEESEIRRRTSTLRVAE